MYRSFEELQVWKRSCKLAVQIYETMPGNVVIFLFVLTECAAVSIASNIAEGAERGGKDFVRDLCVARGIGR